MRTIPKITRGGILLEWVADFNDDMETPVELKEAFLSGAAFRVSNRTRHIGEWFQPGDEISTGGILFGTHVYVKSVIGDHYLVVHIPNHKYWTGVGQAWEDDPSTWSLMRLDWELNGNLYGRMLYEITPGPHWRKAWKMLEEKAHELEGDDHGV